MMCGCVGNVEEEIGVVIPDGSKISLWVSESMEDLLFVMGRTEDAATELRDCTALCDKKRSEFNKMMI